MSATPTAKSTVPASRKAITYFKLLPTVWYSDEVSGRGSRRHHVDDVPTSELGDLPSAVPLAQHRHVRRSVGRQGLVGSSPTDRSLNQAAATMGDNSADEPAE